MKARWLWVVCLVPCVVAAQQKPRMAVLPLEGTTLEKAQRARLSDALYAAVASTGAVVLAPTEDVAKEYERKYQGACPANELMKCLAYLAEHTNATYALKVELKRGMRAKTWEWAASLAAYDGTVLPQPDVFPFVESSDVVFDQVAQQTLKRYVETLNLKALPIVPTRTPDVVTVKPPDGTKVAPPIVTKPVEGAPLKTVGWVTAGVGGVTAVVGCVVLGMAAGDASKLGLSGGAVPPENAAAARSVADRGTLGSVLVGVGVAIAAGGVVMAMLPGEEPAKAPPPRVLLVPTADGAVFSISGSLP